MSLVSWTATPDQDGTFTVTAVYETPSSSGDGPGTRETRTLERQTEANVAAIKTEFETGAAPSSTTDTAATQQQDGQPGGSTGAGGSTAAVPVNQTALDAAANNKTAMVIDPALVAQQSAPVRASSDMEAASASPSTPNVMLPIMGAILAVGVIAALVAALFVHQARRSRQRRRRMEIRLNKPSQDGHPGAGTRDLESGALPHWPEKPLPSPDRSPEMIRDRFEAWLASPTAETEVRRMGRVSVLNAPVTQDFTQPYSARSKPEEAKFVLPAIPQVVINHHDDMIGRRMVEEEDESVHEEDLCSFLSGDEDALALSEEADMDGTDRSSMDSERSGAFGLDSIREEEEMD